MSKKDEFDIDDEIKKIARKTNINIKKTEYSFENQIRKLDTTMDNIINDKIKEFDDNKSLSSKHLNTDYSSSSLIIDNYRRKLKKL